MNLNEIIEKIVEISTIQTSNPIGDMTITYSLDEKYHKQLDEELFIHINGNLNNFKHSDEFEVIINGIIVKFNKKFG